MSFSSSFNVASGDLSLVWRADILKSLKIRLFVSLEMELGSSLHYGFLATAPLSLHSFPSQISNCSDLPFGTQGMSWRLMSRNKRQRNRTKWKKNFSPEEHHRPLLGFMQIKLKEWGGEKSVLFLWHKLYDTYLW